MTDSKPQTPVAGSTASGTALTPDDRAQAFEAQQGAPIQEMQSGERLLVEAYVAFWVIAMVFVWFTWRGANATSRRLEALETAIEKASKKSEPKG